MDCNLDRIAQIQDMPARAVRRYIKRNEVTVTDEHNWHWMTIDECEPSSHPPGPHPYPKPLPKPPTKPL